MSARPEPFVAALPDLPRWVEARGMFFAGRGRALGMRIDPAPAGVVLQTDTRLGVVIGRPEAALIREAAALAEEILAAPEDAAWTARALPDWAPESATLHRLDDAVRLPQPRAGSVRPIGAAELARLSDLPPTLREELGVEARAGAPLVAAWHDGRPVAFCHAGAVTETLWDVSIETLEQYRRQGHAARCAAHLIHELARRGKHPVWGALASNTASAGLARKLGFRAVDALCVFSRAG